MKNRKDKNNVRKQKVCFSFNNPFWHKAGVKKQVISERELYENINILNTQC